MTTRPWGDDEALTARQREAWQVMLREQARLGRSITAASLAKLLNVGGDTAYYLMGEIGRLGYATSSKEPGRRGRGRSRVAVEHRLSRAEVETAERSAVLERSRKPDCGPREPEWVGERTLELSGEQVAGIVQALAKWRRLRKPDDSDGEALAGIVGEWAAVATDVSIYA